MNTILVVDDLAIFRDPIAASLRLAGYRILRAANGKEALSQMQTQEPQLIILDLAMPVMDGLTFLRALRADEKRARLPVVLLTAVSDKQAVLEAARLGVRDFLLKSAFSLKELLERVRRYVEPSKEANSPSAPTAVPHAAPAPARAPQPSPEVSKSASVEVPRLMTRAQCIARAEKALEAKTLSGVVMHVVAMAASPRANMADLAILIGRDPMLSSRVLHAANTAAYMCARGTTSTIPEAVRQIGCSTIRNIAATMGIFEAMPSTGADGFNPIRCWQHSFGVATLCEHLVSQRNPELAGIAYLTGLCHDLGDILIHTHFGKEYERVIQAQKETGKGRGELETAMLGMTHGDLVQTIMRCIGLPDAIQRPIEMFHAAMEGRFAEGNDPLTRCLRLAELYANGILLASSDNALVAPINRADCRQAVGEENPSAPDNGMLRAQVLALTGMLARLSPADEAKLMTPPFPCANTRLCVARDPAFSSFDPIAAAMKSLSNAEILDRLPDPAAVKAYRGLVIVGRSAGTPNFDAAALGPVRSACEAAGVGILWMCGKAPSPTELPPGIPPTLHPIPLARLAGFVAQLTPITRPARALT
jgi:CheY-like chemotaxis protein/HD-like signal output (HDOD) protein